MFHTAVGLMFGLTWGPCCAVGFHFWTLWGTRWAVKWKMEFGQMFSDHLDWVLLFIASLIETYCMDLRLLLVFLKSFFLRFGAKEMLIVSR